MVDPGYGICREALKGLEDLCQWREQGPWPDRTGINHPSGLAPEGV